MIKEFKEFAFKGNLVDMAVGFILGGAFTTVVKSFVANVVMPPIGILLGDINFSDLKIVLKEAVVDAEGKETAAEVAIKYGLVITDLISFTLLALVVFIVVKKVIEGMKKKEEEKPAEPAAPPAEEVLLTEIRDLLKKNA